MDSLVGDVDVVDLGVRLTFSQYVLFLEERLKRLGGLAVSTRMPFFLLLCLCATDLILQNALHQLVVDGKVLYLGISDTPAWVVVKCNECEFARLKVDTKPAMPTDMS